MPNTAFIAGGFARAIGANDHRDLAAIHRNRAVMQNIGPAP